MTPCRAAHTQLAPSPTSSPLPPPRSVTPLCYDAWEAELQFHPDQSLVEYLLGGLRSGFRTGFIPSSTSLSSSTNNMLSATQHPEVVDQYLETECSLGRVAGPFSALPLPNLHISRFGVIPKKSSPGKWRLILDLSSPSGASVNDGIPSDPYRLQYISVDDAINIIMRLGRGALLAKIDVASAYRLIPIHPDERYLLGMRWRGNYFIDLTLPFGLRSAPFIFTQLADALQWIGLTSYHIPHLLHYLDDFLTVGPPDSPSCQQSLDSLISLCARLGVPLSTHKVAGPSTSLEFLGIELDSLNLEARLPADKLSRLKTLLEEWIEKKSCTKRELLSLIGLLQHAAKVVVPGRTFVRRLINLSTIARELHHHIRLSRASRQDLLWWREFLVSWHGRSFFLSPHWAPLPDFQLTTDAAGSLGCGGVLGVHWFALSWPAELAHQHITFKELFPIAVSFLLWGKLWTSRRILLFCDNEAVVNIVNSGTSRDEGVMFLLRRMFLLAAQGSFAFHASHLLGRINRLADALSRFRFQEFHQLHPEADSLPTEVSPELISSLIPSSL